MIIKQEINDLQDFEAWSGAEQTKAIICDECLGEKFIEKLEEVYPDGMTDEKLNDLLWFDEEWCLHLVGLQTDEEIEAKKPENIAEKNGWVIKQIPEWAMRYIFTCKDDNLTDKEKMMIDDYPFLVIDCVADPDTGEPQEAYDSDTPAFGEPCKVVDCYCEEVYNNEKEEK